jgi:hypothetical protein
MRSRIAVRFFALAALAVAFWAHDSVRAAPRAWNQAEAATLAHRLADKAEAFHEEVRRQGPDGSLVPILKDEWDLVELRARHLDERARTLASKLDEGQDVEETRGHWENIETTLRDVAEHSRSEWVTQTMYRTWADLRDIHLQIAEYYGDHDVDPRLEDIRVEPQR